MSTTPDDASRGLGSGAAEHRALTVALLLAATLATVFAAVMGSVAATRDDGAAAEAQAVIIDGEAVAARACQAPNRVVWPTVLICPSERSFKADQIHRLGYPPEVVFFGGSRSTRFEPSNLR